MRTLVLLKHHITLSTLTTLCIHGNWNECGLVFWQFLVQMANVPLQKVLLLLFSFLCTEDHLNMGVQLSSLKVTGGQSIFWYYFHYHGRQGRPGDPRSVPFPSLAPPHSSQHRQKTWWKVPVCQFIQPQQVCYFQWPQSIRFLLLLFDPHQSGSSRVGVSTDQSSQLRRLHCSSPVWSVRTGLSVPPVSVCMDCHNSNCPNSR